MFGRSFLGGGRSVVELPVAEIRPNAYQPRLVFNEEALADLVHSILQHGLAQPVLVRPSEDKGYQLIAGERRLRACKQAGFATIPAIIKPVSDVEALKLALVENLDREDLNPIEEAEGYARLIAEFQYTHQTLAELFGKSRSAVTNTLRIIQLPLDVKDAVQDGRLSEGHARALLGVPTDEARRYFATQAMNQSWTVRQLEAAVTQQRSLDSAGAVKKQVSSATESVHRQRIVDTVTAFFQSDCAAKVRCSGTEGKGRISIMYQSKEELAALLDRFKQ